MTTHDLCLQSISQLAEAIKAKHLSPVELTQVYLDRIGDLDSQLNSYITVAADQALEEAKQAEREIAQDGPRGPLHGIPMAYKDIVATRGMLTTCGSKVLKDHVPDVDGTVITRLRAAGSILLGKLNMNEFATLVPSAYYGPVHNPWHLDHSPGGSSKTVANSLCRTKDASGENARRPTYMSAQSCAAFWP